MAHCCGDGGQGGGGGGGTCKATLLVSGIILAVILMLVAWGLARGAEERERRPPEAPTAPADKPQERCLFCGEKVNPDLHVDGPYRIYFGCPPCLDRYWADPVRATEKLREQGVRLALAPRRVLTCGMKNHPVFDPARAPESGRCPECGMRLREKEIPVEPREEGCPGPGNQG